MKTEINEVVELKTEKKTEQSFLRVWKAQDAETAAAKEYLGCSCGMALGPKK